MKFLRILYQQKHCQLGQKGTERIWNERRLLPIPPSQFSLERSRLVKRPSLQVAATFREKEGWFRGWDQEPREQCWEPRSTSQTLTSNGVHLATFQNCFRPVIPFYLLFLPVWTRMSKTIILCLCHHLMLGADNVYFLFTGPQVDGSCAPGVTLNGLYPESHLNLV